MTVAVVPCMLNWRALSVAAASVAKVAVRGVGTMPTTAASGTIVIESLADVSVALRGPASATANQAFTVGFDVTNAAAENAGSVTVQIQIPDGTTVNSASACGGV